MLVYIICFGICSGTHGKNPKANYRIDKDNYIQTPLRRPFEDFSKAAFVISLNAEVRAPDAARPPRKDCIDKTKAKNLQTFEFCPNNMKNSRKSIKRLMSRLTWMNSGHIKVRSPNIPP